jgi:arylsulfatase A-like enzyme
VRYLMHLLCIGVISLHGCNRAREQRPPLEADIRYPTTERIEPIGSERARRPYNVLLVSIDTLRADRLSAYGWRRPTSPRVDRLAAEGVLFENAFSHSPKTAESHMSLMTGLYPEVHRVQNFAKDQTALHPDIPPLASILHAAGYRTEAYTGGGNVTGALGFDRGFDFYGEFNVYDREGAAFERAGKAIDALGARDVSDDAPFFLFAHTYKVHDPYAPPRSYLAGFADPDYSGPIPSTHEELAEAHAAGKNPNELYWKQVDVQNPDHVQRLQDLYDGEIRYTDDRLRALLGRLDHWGFDRNTLVVLLSDHGEEFMEHGFVRHERLYDEVLHVPLILRFPAADETAPEGGRRIQEVVRLIDVSPSILAYLGIRQPLHLQGRSFLPLIEGRDEPPRFVWSHWYQADHATLRIGPWKFYRRYAFAGLFEVGRWKFFYERRLHEELYDIGADPGELRNLADEQEEIREAMKDLLIELEGASGELRGSVKGDGPTIELDPRTRRELEALGYL